MLKHGSKQTEGKQSPKSQLKNKWWGSVFCFLGRCMTTQIEILKHLSPTSKVSVLCTYNKVSATKTAWVVRHTSKSEQDFLPLHFCFWKHWLNYQISQSRAILKLVCFYYCVSPEISPNWKISPSIIFQDDIPWT